MQQSQEQLRGWTADNDGPAFVAFRCRVCGRRLGSYAPGYMLDRGRPGWAPALPEGGKHWMFRPKDAPRTGTGLSVEGEDGMPKGRPYVRLRCKCGRGQKFRLSTFGDLEVVIEDGEPVVYI